MNSYKYPAFMSTKNKNSETLLLGPNPCYTKIYVLSFLLYSKDRHDMCFLYFNLIN